VLTEATNKIVELQAQFDAIAIEPSKKVEEPDSPQNDRYEEVLSRAKSQNEQRLQRLLSRSESQLQVAQDTIYQVSDCTSFKSLVHPHSPAAATTAEEEPTKNSGTQKGADSYEEEEKSLMHPHSPAVGTTAEEEPTKNPGTQKGPDSYKEEERLEEAVVQKMVFESFEVCNFRNDSALTLEQVTYVVRSIEPKVWTDNHVKSVFNRMDTCKCGQVSVCQFMDWIYQSKDELGLSF
jgi:hypothetical protein